MKTAELIADLRLRAISSVSHPTPEEFATWAAALTQLLFEAAELVAYIDEAKEALGEDRHMGQPLAESIIALRARVPR